MPGQGGGFSNLAGGNIQRRYGYAPGTSGYNFLSRQGNPYGIGGGNTVLPPEAYRGGTGGYPTSTAAVGTAEVRSSLPPAATGVTPGPLYMNLPGSPMNPYGYVQGGIDIMGNFPNPPRRMPSSGIVSDTSTDAPISLNNAFPPGKGQYFQFLSSGDDLQGSSSGPSLLQDVPGEPSVYAPGGKATAGSMVPPYPYAPASAAPMVTNPDYTMPYPMPGGFGRNVPTSYNSVTGSNWVDNAINQAPTDAQGFPIPGGGGNATAPNWAINASRPTAPWGYGPGYVDPRTENAFFGGLAGWNSGNAGFNPSGSEGGPMADARHNIGALAARFGLAGRGGGGGLVMPGKFK